MQNPCASPGMKIRSKGKGRGLARGKGKGPLGTPRFNSGKSPLKGYGGMKNPVM